MSDLSWYESLMSERVQPRLKVVGPGGVMAGCLALAVVLALLDWQVSRVNVSIAHALPVLLYVLLTRKPVPWYLALALMALTMLAYFFKSFTDVSVDVLDRLQHFRMVNRAMVLAVIAGLSLLSLRIEPLTAAWRRTVLGLPSTDPGEDFFDQLDRLGVAALCVALMVMVLVFDLWLPARFNPPILFAVPLVLSAWTCSRRLLWSLAIPAVLLPLVGYFVALGGDSQDASSVPINNRVLTSVVGLLVALSLHIWIGLEARRVRVSGDL